MEPQDTITIAPNVLITVVRHATESVKGIAHMGQIPVPVGRLLKGHAIGNGVILDIHGQTIRGDLYVVVKPRVDMAQVSRDVQVAVKRAVEDLVGMEVTEVNIHIEDVATSLTD